MSTSSKTIANRVKQAREETGLSQKDMSKRLGLTEAGYGHYERDRQTFTVDMLFQISRILGRPVEYFLGLETELSADEGRVLALYRQAQAAGQGPTAIGVLEALTSSLRA
jgi:transcriptional regulator with XRE-family HTH domain